MNELVVNNENLIFAYTWFLKLIVISGVLLYTVFSALIWRQASIMEKTIETKVSPFIKIVATINFIISLAFLAASFLI